MWPLSGMGGEGWKIVVCLLAGMVAAYAAFSLVKGVFGIVLALFAFLAAYALVLRVVEFL